MKTIDVCLDGKMKIKENEKRDKYLELARELKRPRSIKGMMISIVIEALGTITKGLLSGAENRRTRRDYPNYGILRRVLDTWGDLLSPRLHWKTIS